jgi:hypothetical protein
LWGGGAHFIHRCSSEFRMLTTTQNLALGQPTVNRDAVNFCTYIQNHII